MGVVAIWRYPVKAMLGELLDIVHVGARGLIGDRMWVVVDKATGERIANKRGPTDPRLRACRAQLDPGEDEGDDVLHVTLPDGETVSGSAVDGALSELLERHVRLDEADGAGRARLGMPAAHHDFAPVHLLTTRTLAHLNSVAPATTWDVRRFRPNLVLDDGHVPGEFTEDRLMGAELRGPSGVRLAVRVPTPRCVVPTRACEELSRDPGLLRTIAQHHRVDLGHFGRQPCVGAYAEIEHEGRLGVGEQVEVRTAAAMSPQAAVAESIQRLVDEFGPG
jgi:MOSC domain-containing protein